MHETDSAQGPPFRAEHIGSLLRPRALTSAWRALRAGTLDESGYQPILEEAIREAVRLQEEAGLPVVTDGEFRRASYWSHFLEGIEGMTVAPAAYRFRDESGTEQGFLAPRVVGRIERARPLCATEHRFLASVTRRTPKLTMPSPSTFHFWGGEEAVSRDAYGDDDAFFADLVRVYREELAERVEEGLPYVQLDEVPIAMLCDERVRGRLRERGQDPDGLVHRYIELVNEVVADLPGREEGGPVVGLHLCRGNFAGRWLSEGGYDRVARALFRETKVDVFLLEYDTGRAGSFHPLEDLPPGKRVVLGLVSSKRPELEPLSSLEQRVEEAARHAPLDQLGLSPQCGFSSTVRGNPVTPEIQQAKLARVVEAARHIWGSER